MTGAKKASKNPPVASKFDNRIRSHELPVDELRVMAMPAVSLRLLGPFAVVLGAGDVRLPRKAQALLTLLAVQRDHVLAREAVADFLWPGSGPEQSRHSLRQCLLVLRKQLDCDLVQAENGVLRLAADCFTSDLAEFAALAGSQDILQLGHCAELYQGELAANLPPVSPQFDDWLAGERRRIADLAAGVLRRLAVSLAGTGQFDDAIRAARRLVAADNLNEPAHRLLMTVLAQDGQRTEALRQYAVCVETLRSELGVAPERETAALAHAIKEGAIKEGAIKEAPIQEAPPATGRQEQAVPGLAAPDVAASRSAVRAGAGWRWWRSFRPRYVPAAVLICLTTAAAFAALAVHPGDAMLPKVAMLPLHNVSSAPKEDGAIAGLGDAIALDLGGKSGLRLVQYQTVEHGDLRLLREKARADASIRYFVEGTASFTNRLEASISVSDRQGAAIWSQQFDVPIAQSLQVADDIVSHVKRALSQDSDVIRGPSEPGIAARLHQAREFYALAARIKRPATVASNAEAQRAIGRALEADPNNPDVIAFLANTHLTAYSLSPKLDPAEFAQVDVLVKRALELDPNNVLALWEKCHQYHVGQDLDSAIEVCRRALDISPRFPPALRETGLLLLEMGNPAEAIGWLNAAISVEPDNPFVGTARLGIGLAELVLDHPDQAIQTLRQSIERDHPGNPAGLWLSVALELSGRHGEAVAAMDEFQHHHPEYRACADYPWPADTPGLSAVRPRVIESFHHLGFELQAANPDTSVH